MAKKNETLTQRQKAQRDLIELKKMQRGEIDPGPKPSEEAVLPKTFKEKLVNFFYHYKYVVLASVFAAVVLTILIVNLVTRVDYDTKIVVFSYDVSYDLYNEKIAEYFESICPDINDNGSVDVAVIDCSYAPDSMSQTQNAKLTRLNTMLSVEDDALLFLMDEESVKHFENIDVKLFKEENFVALGDDFYEFIEIEELGLPRTKLFAVVREIGGTTIDGKNPEAYEAAKQVIDELRAKAVRE